MILAGICLLILVATGWWLRRRWSEMRDAEARREEAATLSLLHARSPRRPGPPVTPEAASSFYPTLPGKG